MSVKRNCLQPTTSEKWKHSKVSISLDEMVTIYLNPFVNDTNKRILQMVAIFIHVNSVQHVSFVIDFFFERIRMKGSDYIKT